MSDFEQEQDTEVHDEETQNSVQVGTKRRRTASKVWDDFDRVVGLDNKATAKCKHCKRDFTTGGTQGTSHLKKHIEMLRCPVLRDDPSRAKSTNQLTPKVTSFQFDRSRQDLENDDMGCGSVEAACLQQIIAASNVLKMVERRKGDGDGYELLRKSSIEQISTVANVLFTIDKEKGNKMDDVLALNRTLITKERECNLELEEARKALVEGLPDFLIQGKGITTKRMGEIAIEPFGHACEKKYPSDEANEKASELCSLWQERLSDPSFYPFKGQTVQGMRQDVLDEEDCELKKLREEWGGQVYEAVTLALKEMNQYNPSGRYPVSVLWNSHESRRATLKEVVNI